jgi:hypothetical protein
MVIREEIELFATIIKEKRNQLKKQLKENEIQ